ncbi:MAG: hypothetical protein WA821_18995 [Anaerolineales bacterium]
MPEPIIYRLSVSPQYFEEIVGKGGFDMAAGQHRRLSFDKLRTPLNHRWLK